MSAHSAELETINRDIDRLLIQYMDNIRTYTHIQSRLQGKMKEGFTEIDRARKVIGYSTLNSEHFKTKPTNSSDPLIAFGLSARRTLGKAQSKFNDVVEECVTLVDLIRTITEIENEYLKMKKKKEAQN